MNRLLTPLTNHHDTKFCQDCLKQFSSKKAFESVNHKCNYKNNLDSLPENMTIKDNKLLKCPLNSYIRPYNLRFSQCLPWVMYCDFESILIPVKDEKHPDKNEHKLSSYCYNLVCHERPSFNKFKLYRGNENDSISVIDNFFNDIKDFLSHIQNCKRRYSKLPMLTDEELKEHQKMKNCQYCNIVFDDENIKVQHHNHLTGDFIATTCKPCNSKMKTDNCLYITFHYMKGYDGNFILEKLNEHFKDSNINLIGRNSSSIIHIGIENYIKIIDSHEFITASLKNLSSNLKPEDIKYTKNG